MEWWVGYRPVRQPLVGPRVAAVVYDGTSAKATLTMTDDGGKTKVNVLT